MSLSSRDEAFEKNYKEALGAYEDLRNKLEGKLPTDKSSKRKSEQQPLNKQSSKGVVSSKNKSSQSSKGEKAEAEDVVKTKHKCFNSAYCSLCDDLCNTDMSSSLSKIDEMSSYLMDMLRDV